MVLDLGCIAIVVSCKRGAGPAYMGMCACSIQRRSPAMGGGEIAMMWYI